MRLIACAMLGFVASPAAGEVVSSSPESYVLRHEATSTLTPDALWSRLVQPETWWHPDHTYSGDAANLSLEATAGGQWREDWADGSVIHGEVLLVQSGSTLRLDAPFGPLQEMAVDVVWTINVLADEAGSKVVFDEVATGAPASALDRVAPAVDFVKQEAITRLTSAE